MTYDDLNVLLIEKIPEIKSSYNNELEWWDNEAPGAHIIFGDVLNPFLIDLLSTMRDRKLIDRLFEFFEEMALADDEMVKEVLVCTILERLGDDKTILEKAEPFMRANTRFMSSVIERDLGRL